MFTKRVLTSHPTSRSSSFRYSHPRTKAIRKSEVKGEERTREISVFYQYRSTSIYFHPSFKRAFGFSVESGICFSPGKSPRQRITRGVTRGVARGSTRRVCKLCIENYRGGGREESRTRKRFTVAAHVALHSCKVLPPPPSLSLSFSL